MKGISTILATILIVIIVVAMVSLTYTFAIDLFGSSTKPAEIGITTTTQKIDKRISFVIDPSCTWLPSDYVWQISFSIRHEGSSSNITLNEVSAFFGNDPGTISGWGTEPLSPGRIKTLTVRNNSAVNWSKTDLFTVVAPGNDVSRSITC